MLNECNMSNIDIIKKQLFAYGVVGLLGTGVHYLLFILIYNFLRIPAAWASSCGFVVGAVINHNLNRRYVFSTRNTYICTSLRFYTVALFGLILNYMLMYIQVELFYIHYLLSQLVSTAMVFLATFLVNRVWTFGTPKPC